MNASFLAFKELITRYPDSRYAKDSALRMTYLINALAAHELHVARYYMKRQAYLASINRCKYVIENFPQSTSLEEALVIMISAYDFLEMQDLKEDTMRVLKTNYPDSKMLGKGVSTDERTWWKFWDSL
jgi:outer membrane protein assembly factor BamD